MIKKIIQSAFNILGFRVVRNKPVYPAPVAVPFTMEFQENSMEGGLNRFLKLGLQVNTIIDVGAAEGKWSLLAKPLFSQANYVLFEPLVERKDQLESLLKENSNFHYVPKAAGKEKGSIHFIISPDLDGSGVTYDSDNHNTRSVEVASIQEELQQLKLKGPFIIKLDTHGFEVPIIEGCTKLLDQVQLFIIECYGFEIVKDSLLFWQMCNYMDELGFRVFDIVDIMHRSKDGAFWQCDAFFIRKSHTLFLDNRYA